MSIERVEIGQRKKEEWMHPERATMAFLRNGDSALPFKPEEYDVQPLDITGVSFNSVGDFVKKKGATTILVDVPEEARDAIGICRWLKSDPDFESFPLIALLQLPTRAIVTAVIEAGVDEALLLPTSEKIIAERLERLIPMGFSVEAAMTNNASPPL